MPERALSPALQDQVERHLRTRVVIGPGRLERLGELAQELGLRRTLLVSDRGLVEAGHARRAADLLRGRGIEVRCFHDFHLNPTSTDIERGREVAAGHRADSFVGLGGGSSMDCAKGINFLLTNGGTIADYQGYDRTHAELLPMIGVPTTAGTGSEAQSYALISDAETHVKMACGAPSASFRVAILDPELLRTTPREVRAVAGYDAVSHAVESFVTRQRSPVSADFAREAWRLLASHYTRAVESHDDLEALSAMQWGAFLAGAAIEHSMLGAAHACANPLTARYETTHGVAIALLLHCVVRWNGGGDDPEILRWYEDLADVAGLANHPASPAERLALLLEKLAVAGGLETRLRRAGVDRENIPELAAAAARQWTGKFNPRPFDAEAAREIYECAY